MAQGRVGMAADVSVVAMTADFGAEIRGVDLAIPLSEACFQAVLEAFHRYGVVFLRAQKLDPRLLVRFAARFGEIEHADGGFVVPGLPQVRVLGASGRTGRTEPPGWPVMHWHSDGACDPQPTAVTIIHVVQCPGVGAGGVEFANLHAAYAALPRNRRLFVERLRGLHGQEPYLGTAKSTAAESTSRVAVEHPIVRRHPATGAKVLFASTNRVSRILGLTAAEGRRLLDELETFATQPRFIYSHAWRQGDVLVWDNRCTLHRSMAFDPRTERVLHRVRVRGEVPLSA